MRVTQARYPTCFSSARGATDSARRVERCASLGVVRAVLGETDVAAGLDDGRCHAGVLRRRTYTDKMKVFRGPRRLWPKRKVR
jgi:hypothetical protein